MVAPNENILNLIRVNLCSISNHADSSILIKSSHGREVFSWDRWCIMRADESISVSWVAYHSDFYSLLCNLVDCLTLCLENLSICLKKVCTFHAWASWSCTNKDSNISILEGNERVCCWDNIFNARVSSILKFHDKTL